MAIRRGIGLLGLVAGMTAMASGDDPAYRAEVEAFRVRREAGLKAEDGWLSVAGLAWLRPGEATLGSDPGCDVVLPASAPANVGVLSLAADGSASFRPDPAAGVTLGGRPFAGGAIRSDAKGGPDALAVGPVRLLLIKRGARHALRIKDNTSPIRTKFAGLRWFPVAEGWRLAARFVAHPEATQVVFDTIVGEPEVESSPGYVTFTKGGSEYRLDAVTSGGTLWFVFRDGTSGKATHPGARQLTADAPSADGTVILDFNKATNLPCAYTPFATCPLAPPRNRLKLAVEAGEMKYQP